MRKISALSLPLFTLMLAACSNPPAELPDPPPASWTCSDSFYDSGDGCDCECGAYDPDCDDPSQSVLGCSDGVMCTSAGICEDTCVPSTATSFRISLFDVMVAGRKGDGTDWDPDSSYPDPYVCIGPASAPEAWGCSTRVIDTQTPSIDTVFEGSLSASEPITIRIWDNDLLDDDEIGQVSITLDEIRAMCGLQRAEGDAGAFFFEVTPL